LECLRDPKNSIFFFEESKRIIKPTSNGDGTIYSFDNAKGQFFITIPNDQEKKISIDADTLIANAIIHAVGDKSIDVTPRDGYRCRCKDLSLTPQQLQTLISNFSSLLKYLKNPSQSSSSPPLQTQEPAIIGLWSFSEGNARS
jgi:hypothetical protein